MMKDDALDSIQALNQTVDKYHITDYLNLQGPSSPAPSSSDCSSTTATSAAAAADADASASVTAFSSSSSQHRRQPEQVNDSNDNDNYDVPTLEKDDIMDMEAREMLVEWCFRVTHHFHVSNKIVAYAMNYMDRCCSFYQGKIPKDFVRLIMASSLFLSIKIHHTVIKHHHPEEEQHQLSNQQQPPILKLTPSTTSQLLSQLTEGQYSSYVIARFESVLIRVLGCNLLPPLPFRYLQEYLVILQSSYAIKHVEKRGSNPDSGMTSMDYRTVEDTDSKLLADEEELFMQDISTKAFQLCDVAVSSYYLSVLVKPSIVALAALCNSLTFYAVEESNQTAGSYSRHQMFLNTRPLDLVKVVLPYIENSQDTLLLQVQDMLWQMACLDDELDENVEREGVLNACNHNTASRHRPHYQFDSDSSERNKSTPHSVMDTPNETFRK